MERLLNRLERRWGRYSIENLTLVLVAAQAAALVLNLARPGFAALLLLDPAQVRAGQYWRLISYLFLPPSFDPLWALLALYWLYVMGSALENQWGAFKYQVYWLTGTLLTSLGAFAFDVPADNRYLVMSLFLAFATLWPKYEILLFFIVPVQVRWLALLDALLLVMAVGAASGWGKLVPVLAVSNYLLFFGGHLTALLRGKAFEAQSNRRRKAFAREESVLRSVRTCAVCGVSSETDPHMDFRVCTCPKHNGKPTELCLEHARNH